MYIISKSWDSLLRNEFEQQYLKVVQNRLKIDIAKGLKICPPVPLIFDAYKHCDYNKVKVLILGQDPYYSGVADGLAFSSLYETPALDVMFKEIKGSTGQVRTETTLHDWAAQGVLLLNTILTTVRGTAKAHQNIGWERLTKLTMQLINARKEPLVVMLWGSHAITYAPLFNGRRHLVLKAPHPASDAYSDNSRTFRGCQHFSLCNDFLESHNLQPIHWGDPINPIV